MRILGIDPGLRLTGYGVVDYTPQRPKLIDGGVLRLNVKASLADRLLELNEELASLFDEFHPEVCAVEQLYAHYAHPRTAILMGHARGVILLSAKTHGAEVHEFSANRIKQSVTGHGHAGKASMQRTIQLLWNLPQPPDPPDVADALAVALCCGRFLDGQPGRAPGKIAPTMISAMTGQLSRVEDDRVQVKAGALVFQLLVPAADLAELSASVGQEVTFHTILDLEGDPTRGNLAPRLIGFLRPQDKRFFELFTTVKGIGPKKALRALTVPVNQIARAIEAKDARELANLEGIGKRMAELIVAELCGKAQAFIAGGPGHTARPVTEEDALLVCQRLGLARADAERLLEKVKQSQPALTTAQSLSREMLRLRTVP